MTTIECTELEEPTTDLAELPPMIVDPWAKARYGDGHGTLTHLFFSDDLLDIARAKAICSKCPLAAECLDGALEPSSRGASGVGS